MDREKNRDKKERMGEGSNRPSRPRNTGKPTSRRGPIGLAPIPGRAGAFDLTHPRCVDEARLDYEEGMEFWKAGDPAEARDALRYALQACGDNLWVHAALGKLALQEFKDPVLARGHFGYAVELARQAIPDGFSGQLPRDRHANHPFYEALDGLVASLRALGKGRDADGLAALANRLAGGPARAAGQGPRT
jgi:hypothetical protein